MPVESSHTVEMLVVVFRSLLVNIQVELLVELIWCTIVA